jgi:hypothetical protein
VDIFDCWIQNRDDMRREVVLQREIGNL